MLTTQVEQEKISVKSHVRVTVRNITFFCMNPTSSSNILLQIFQLTVHNWIVSEYWKSRDNFPSSVLCVTG